MGKSGRVRLGELRRAYRLIHDCRDVGRDRDAWSGVLAERLAPLIHAPVVVVGRIVLDAGRPPRNELFADRGWESTALRDLWYQRRVVESDYRGSETFPRFLAAPFRLKTRSREQLIDGAEWYRSFEFNEINRPMGQDDLAIAARLSDGPTGGALFVTIGMRPLGTPPIPARQRRLLRLFHAELDRHIGRSMLLDPADPFAALQPRLRRTLDCLLEGDSEKQASARLGLARSTVHEYVKALYRHFDVASRAELMAHCHRLLSGRRS